MKRSRRFGLAMVAALVAHGLVVLLIEKRDLVRHFEVEDTVAVDIRLVPRPLPPERAPEPETPEPEPAPEPAPRPKPPPTPERDPPPTVEPPPVEARAPVPDPPTPTPPPTPPEPAEPPPPSVADPAPSTNSESVMRLPVGPPSVNSVAGGTGPFRTSTEALEGALETRVEGPVSDLQRAVRTAGRNLQDDLADDAVSAGLADDYFRVLLLGIRTHWKPAMKELNDGGASTTQLGMMKSLGSDTSAWGEMWLAYMDLAKQYANGLQPRLETNRIERLRELMRSRRGAFRVQAIVELKLTQDKDGKIILLEVLLPSGHPGIDEGVRTAIVTAVQGLPEPPPERLSHGRPFSSWWRLRATWKMIPPTAFFTGTSFDITPKGFEVDVPFQIKLTTNSMLLRTDSRTTFEGAAAATE